MNNKNISANEIIHVAEAVARDKGLSKDSIIEALEEAIAVASRRKYGNNIKIKAHINRNQGNIEIYREELVVKDGFLNYENSITLNDNEQRTCIEISNAKMFNPDVKEGDVIKHVLPPFEIGRLNAISAKQVIVSKVKELEKNRIFQEYNDRVGEILNGVVEKIEIGCYIVKLGSAEAIIKKDQILKTDFYKLGDRIRAYLDRVDKESNGPILVLSRTHKEFVAQLFKQEIPEVYDKIIQIKCISRDPGSRTKVAVYSCDPSIDPVGSCVGMRGVRVQAIIKELRGEKIDIIKWSEDPATFVVNAFGASSNVSKVVIDEEQRRIEVVVPEEEQSQIIGRRGQNVKLISELVGWRINITTEEQESIRRQEDFKNVTALFIEALNLEEILAQLLSSQGFTTIESLAQAEVSSIASIEGLDEEIANELISRAKNYIISTQEKK